jgi:hypothetical protein
MPEMDDRFGLQTAGLNLEDIDWDIALIMVWGEEDNEHSCRCRPMWQALTTIETTY